MALPTIYNNTPSPGWITWTATNVAYADWKFTIPAGSTDKAYTYWKFDPTTPQIISTNDYPTDLTPADCFLFLNKQGVGLLVPNATGFDGGLVVPGSIYAFAIHADEIKSWHITSDAIESNHVSAEAITVDKLTAGSVSDNLVSNPSFEDVDDLNVPIEWEFLNGTNGGIYLDQANAQSGVQCIRIDTISTTANQTFRQKAAKLIPVYVAAGRSWYVAARVASAVAANAGSITLRVNWYNNAKTQLAGGSASTTVEASATSSTWVTFENQVTPPAGAKYMGVEVQVLNPSTATSFYVDNIVAREIVVSAMIGNGQVVASKLSAASVTATAIAAKAIGAQHMVVADLNNYWQTPDFEGLTAGTQPPNIVANTLCRVKDISAWTGPVSPAVVDGTTDGNGSARALEIDALNGSQNDVYDNTIIPVTPGDSFWLYADGRYLNTAGTTGAGSIGFRTYNKVKTIVNNSVVATLGTTKVVKMTPMTGVYVVPAGVYFVQPWVAFTNNGETTNKFIVDNIEYRKQNAGNLIVDGAIDGTTINGVTVTGSEIKTAGDAQTGVWAQMGQYVVSDFSGADRPGFGFLKPAGGAAKIGMFSEDAETLTVMGNRAINGTPESYIKLNKDLIEVYNTKKIDMSTDGMWIGSIDMQTHVVNLDADEKIGYGVQSNGYRMDVSRWFSLTLAGAWTAYVGGGGYFQGLRYRREGSSVRIQGMIKNGAVGSTITTIPDATGIYTYLPARPDYAGLYLVAAGTSGTPRQVAYVIVGNNGVITYDTGPAAPTFVSIDISIPMLPEA